MASAMVKALGLVKTSIMAQASVVVKVSGGRTHHHNTTKEHSENKVLDLNCA